MESDESRPGSSASVSSDSSGDSENFRPSSPIQPASPINQKSPVSSHGSSSHKSRSQTRSKSGSRSTSSSSENENLPNIAQSDSNQATTNNNEQIRNSSPHSNSSRSSSSNENSHGRLGNVSRNQSISPVRKSRSSRNSSLSSTPSQDRESTGKMNGGRLQNDDDEYNKEESALNMSHEDLSDVSDMESERNDIKRNARESKENLFNEDEETNARNNKSTNQNKHESGHEDDEEDGEDKEENDKLDDAIITDLRQKLDQKKNQLKAMTKEKNGDLIKSNGSVSDELDDLEKKHDEDALDFEAEEGECPDIKDDERPEKEPGETDKKDSDGEVEEGEELEEGEVTDEEEKRPEETEPKPVCRFYTRGQCTWGMSCRFLHPGVTDKGNYTMFDMVRPVPVSHGAPLPNNFGGHGGYHDYRTERPALHHRPPLHHHPAYVAPHHDPRILPPVVVADPPVPMVESAWERGLRTAKEMMRKANKRKEQDMDFEDKKMNLTLSQDELEKDNYYIRDRASPDAPPPFPAARHPPPAHFEPDVYSPPAKFGRGLPIFEEDPYGRTPRYRELPPHRMPQYEDERRVRPAREVIVQRVENVGRGDEWNDPWMRSKSPQARSGPDSRERPDKRIPRSRRSYSSNSSYSSSSTSHSGSSSESSRSPTPDPRRRRYSTHKSPPPPRRHIKTAMRSPSPRRRRSPTSHVVNEFKEHKVKKVDLGARRSPIKKRHISPSSISEKRVISPGGKRKKISPLASRKVAVMEKTRKRRRTGGSSSSGSSDSSGSDSESSYSSSSEDSSSRANTPVKRPTRNIEKTITERKVVKKGIELPKKRSPISIEIKKPTSNMQITPDGNSQSSSSTPAGSKKTTRREELLKQLRAVEDAIARKRSKLN